MHMRADRMLGAFLVTLILSAAPAAAAITLRGTVRDAAGAVVDKAEVLLTTPELTVIATARSDASGGFTISAPAPGTYLLIVRASAFGETRQAVTVGSAEGPPLSVVLQVAGFEEEVTVTATRENVDSLRLAAQPVNVVNADEIAARVKTVVAQAVKEEAGVQLQQTSPTMAGIFVRGLTGNKVNVFVDGVRYSNGAQRGGVNTFLDLIEPEALETVEVVRGPSSAQYGSDALGGSIHFFSKPPALGIDGFSRWGGTVTAAAGSGHRYGGGSGTIGYRGNAVGVTATLSGRNVGTLRPGDGIDSHAAVTRFLGVPSDLLMDDRLPNTSFAQTSGVARVNWVLNPSTSLVSSYHRTVQDGGDRYDQMLGGDGNFISELNDMSLDLLSTRLERLGAGPFEHVAVTYSLNSQREERVNQGGNGNPTATIGQEPERTTVNGVHGAATSQLSNRQTLTVGGDIYFETLTSEAFNVNPVTNVITERRPRVPDGATYRQGGVYAQTAYEAMPSRVRLVGSVRYGGAHYEAHAVDSPATSAGPLWPDDSLGVSDVSFRASAVITPDDRWTILGSVSRGFRAPHMTDLGTLGLTGSGFEVAAPDVAGLNGSVGTTADASAVSTGDAVEQVGPETSTQWEGVIRFRRPAFRTEFAVFVNNVHDNIQKQSLILPQGAVGTSLGGQPITSQNANGVVFVALSPNPVLVRANFDNARLWGIEHSLDARLRPDVTLRTAFTFVRAEDTHTHLPPNIEGGTPAPQIWFGVRYAPKGRAWWVEPYGNIAAKQTHLSSLDLGDRRTGSGRTRASIQAFFRNGARFRGWTSAGPDGVFNNADDTLVATGETLAQIQDRVLGVGVNSSSLFPELPGYAVFGVRGGYRFGRHELLVDLENLGDENYRGISWGVDGPGRGVSLRYVARF
jgi:hemoglobin/transferrin/lactoferrin receptor protein